MFYVPVSSEENAEDLSRKLYKLSRPISNPGDETQYYSAWYVHPTNDQVVIELPESDVVPISIDAQYDLLDGLFQPFITAGYVPASLLDELHQKINDSKGLSVNLFDLLPQFWKSQAKSQEDMIAEGWFN